MEADDRDFYESSDRMATVPKDLGFLPTVTDLLITMQDFTQVVENKENILTVKPESTDQCLMPGSCLAARPRLVGSAWGWHQAHWPSCWYSCWHGLERQPFKKITWIIPITAMRTASVLQTHFHPWRRHSFPREDTSSRSEILMDKLQAQRKWELLGSGKRLSASHTQVKRCPNKPGRAGEARGELSLKRSDFLFAFNNPPVHFHFKVVHFSTGHTAALSF